MNQLFASGSQSIRASASANPSSENSRLISFRINWFDLLAVQGTLKSLLHDQRLSAARSASINDFISTFQPLDQRLSAA